MNDRQPIEIRAVAAELIRPLRHRVLRAGLPIHAAVFENDDEPSTYHVAALNETQTIIGCATLMLSSDESHSAWRLRGMAVDATARRLGIGRRLVAACHAHALRHSPPRLWCNARTPAVPFYESLGWQRLGTEFDIPSAGPHFKMRISLLNQ